MMTFTSIEQKTIDMVFDIQKAAYDDLSRYTSQELSSVVEQGKGDVIYRIDVKPDRIVEEYFQRIGEEIPILGISEKDRNKGLRKR